MHRTLIYLFIVSIISVSCSYFETNKETAKSIVVDTVVDFNTVDDFPLFPNCKNIPSRDKQQICFQMEMSQHIYAALKEHHLNATDSINDTVMVKIKVDNLGKISLSGILISDRTKQQLPNFDSIVKVSLQSLPTLAPAIKRSIPVTTEFILPIVLTNKVEIPVLSN